MSTLVTTTKMSAELELFTGEIVGTFWPAKKSRHRQLVQVQIRKREEDMVVVFYIYIQQTRETYKVFDPYTSHVPKEIPKDVINSKYNLSYNNGNGDKFPNLKFITTLKLSRIQRTRRSFHR
ncbi:hypothetical protein WA026_017295 [Henosepilachna vigintioctopunctata]|uniref:Uncharacterized protein n=1 Tax=Henosepilachna vigintioctopunctata TaxID=420089 RepID=A0AAW1UP89_9CUCU